MNSVQTIEPTSVTSAEAAEGEHSARTRLRDRLEPGHIFVLAVAFTILALTIAPITDIDSFWHVLIGQEILRTHRIDSLGNSWSLYAGGQHWQTSQWASEVVMAWAHEAFGWAGLVWLRTLMAFLIVLSLCVMLLRRASPLASALVLALVLGPTYGVLQERPLLVSLLLLIWLSALAYDLLVQRRQPRWFIVLPVVAIWANFHGLWVLAPAAFGLVAVALLLDRDPTARPAVMAALRSAGLALLAGCLTPLGPKGLLLPFTFRSATADIAEWKPVVPTSGEAAGLVALVLIVVIIWARSSRPIAWSKVVVVLTWFIFAMTAYRNILPSALMIAPLAAAELGATRLLRARPGTVEQRKALAVVGTLVIVIGLATVGVMLSRVEPLSKTVPLAIAQRLDSTPGDKRILNGYDVAGPLVALGGNDIKLAIDGRSDRFGGDYIRRYIASMNLGPGWQDIVREVNPNYAVLSQDAALTYELINHRGWSSVMSADGYVLLQAPTSSTQAKR